LWSFLSCDGAKGKEKIEELLRKMKAFVVGLLLYYELIKPREKSFSFFI